MVPQASARERERARPHVAAEGTARGENSQLISESVLPSRELRLVERIRGGTGSRGCGQQDKLVKHCIEQLRPVPP